MISGPCISKLVSVTQPAWNRKVILETIGVCTLRAREAQIYLVKTKMLINIVMALWFNKMPSLGEAVKTISLRGIDDELAEN
jgi:hypothetical protein